MLQSIGWEKENMSNTICKATYDEVSCLQGTVFGNGCQPCRHKGAQQRLNGSLRHVQSGLVSVTKSGDAFAVTLEQALTLDETHQARLSDRNPHFHSSWFTAASCFICKTFISISPNNSLGKLILLKMQQLTKKMSLTGQWVIALLELWFSILQGPMYRQMIYKV